MIKIELVKKTYIDLYIYCLYLFVIAFLVKRIYDSGGSNGMLIIVVLAILATLRLVPVLPLKRHKKYGYLVVENERLEIEHHRRKVSYDVSQIDNLKIKLTGFDGQPCYKHMEYLRAQDMDKKRLANGLGNSVRFDYKMNHYKFELYFDREDAYEEFKNRIAGWNDKFPAITLNVFR